MKPCSSIPCPDVTGATVEVLPWIPTVAELRQAGAAIMQPDGTFYSLRDGEVVHLSADREVISE